MDEHYEYRTGRTDPAESSRGLVALVLICAIFLGGLASALSVMQISLFRGLQNSRRTPVSFSAGVAVPETEDGFAFAGMFLQEQDPVYQQLHQLPQGLYVAQIQPGSQGENLHIQPGDVLTHLDGTPISTLKEAQKKMKPRKPHKLRLWRDGREISVTLPE